MKNKLFYPLFLCLFALFLFPLAKAADENAPIRSTSQAFAPILDKTKELAVLHSNLYAGTHELFLKATEINKNPAAFPASVQQLTAGRVVQFSLSVPATLQHLEHAMHLLHYALLEKGINSLDGKFTYWEMEYDAATDDVANLADNTPDFQKEASANPQKVLQDASPILSSLSEEFHELDVRFYILANILELFRQSGYKLLPAPDRVLGETYEQHCKRTGHCGVADPMKPSKIFKAHSIYAIKDKNPKHDVWACEATVLDFLQGRVKGQEYPYKNTASTPFCYRCHARRKGQHNFPWCVLGNSKDLVQACNIIESAANKK